MSYDTDFEDEYLGSPGFDDWSAEDREHLRIEVVGFSSDDEDVEEVDGHWADDDLSDEWEHLAHLALAGTRDLSEVREHQGPETATCCVDYPSELEAAELGEKRFFSSPNAKLASLVAAGFRKARVPERTVPFVIRALTTLGEKARNTDRAVLLTTLAGAYSDLERYGLALDCAERSMSLMPTVSHPYLAAGRAAHKLGLTPLADFYFAQGQALKPAHQAPKLVILSSNYCGVA